MNLYVVRHGETDQNVLGLIQGKRESKLTENGKNLASQLFDTIKSKNIDIVFSSPLSRAYDTSLLITNNMLPINVDVRIKERDFGLYEGRNRHEFDFVSYWNYDRNLDDNEVESMHSIYNRVLEFVKELKEQHHDKNVLIVTHSGICRIIHYIMVGIPEDGDFSKIKVPNLGINEYKI